MGFGHYAMSGLQRVAMYEAYSFEPLELCSHYRAGSDWTILNSQSSQFMVRTIP